MLLNFWQKISSNLSIHASGKIQGMAAATPCPTKHSTTGISYQQWGVCGDVINLDEVPA
jgi:hypothetical protein